MNSSKTANLLMLAHNYRSQGKRVILMKPSIDTRFGESKIASRAVEGMEADMILFPETNSFKELVLEDVHCILVDEAQFLSDTNVEALRKLTDKIPVICYGLRTDYRSQLFPGAKRLMELADTIEEIKTVCVQCDHKAIINAKFHQCGTMRSIIRDGSDKPDLGAEEKYQPMCWKCWSC
jgi:thymidine kinase